jgi:hypothetical protein
LAFGGFNSARDFFLAGSINSVRVGGDANNLTIGAGLNPLDGIFHNGNDTIAGGSASKIAELIVKGSASSNSYFAAGSFGEKSKIAGASVNPQADPRFFVG